MEHLYWMIIFSAQIITFQLITSPRLSRFAFNSALSRNPEWVQENVALIANLRPISAWAPRSLGGFLLLLIIIGGAFRIDNQLMHIASYGSMIAFCLQHLGYDLWLHRKLRNSIPSSPNRTASLTLRKFSDFINPLWFYAVVTLAILNLLFWYLHSEKHGTFHLISFAFVYFAMIISIWFSIKRRPEVPNVEISLFYRKLEVLSLWWLLIAFVLDGWVRVSGLAYSIDLFNGPLTDYFFTLLALMIFIGFTLHPTFKKISNAEILPKTI